MVTPFRHIILAGLVALSAGEELHGQGFQARIDAAGLGDTIVVDGGTVEGPILISRRLNLIGRDGAAIIGSGEGSVVTITADSCELSGFRIMKSGGMLAGEDAGVMVQSRGNRIRGNHLSDVLFGIYLWGADENLISDNVIEGMSNLGVGQRGSGIHVYDSEWNRFVRNRITAMRDGFYILYANHSTIEECEVYEVRYGLHYMYADSNVFVANSFHHNTAGAAIMYSTGIRMRHNEFRDNRGFSSYGILFQDCHQLKADSNRITDNTTGMFLEASTQNEFSRNLIARNDIALQMFQNSVSNRFSENDFIDNLTPLTIVGRRTGSEWSVNGRGNYWSSYDGYDLDGDGIGDVPMKIRNVFQFLEGQTPGVRLYLYSPASQALALAASSFPLMDLNREIDSSPLMRPVVAGVFTAAGRSSDRSGGFEAGWPIVPAAGLLVGGMVFYRLSRRKG